MWRTWFLAAASLALASAGLVDHVQDTTDAMGFSLVTEFIRTEANVIRLQNDTGVERNRLPCDGPLDKCDPLILAYINTERPNYDLGWDSARYRIYEKFLRADDINSPNINEAITRDIGNKGSKKVNVQVGAEDVDTMRNNDKIDSFSRFNYWLDPSSTPVSTLKWSAEILCDGLDRKGTKLYFKYRWYNVQPAVCRPSSNDRGLLGGMLS